MAGYPRNGSARLRALPESYFMNRFYFAFVLVFCTSSALAQSWTPTIISDVLERWQSAQDQLRVEVAADRATEFDFQLLPMLTLNRDSAETLSEDALEPRTLAGLPKRLVVVLGGLQGRPGSTQRFAECLHSTIARADVRVATFVYPNDGPIARSAAVLEKLLKHIDACAPQTRVTLITHSMGGLVARYCVEPADKLLAGHGPTTNVDQLIMICPPNHGSVLAQYADALELADALHRMKEDQVPLRQILQSLVSDGIGEACEELVPNSELLQCLNSRPRAQGVNYHIIAGTAGPIGPMIRLATTVAIEESFANTRVGTMPDVSDVLQRVHQLVASDEFARGLGDGAVSVASARLEGVSHLTLIPMQHTEWSDTDKPLIKSLVRTVADKVSR